ncbi:MAG TPA: hypothetical protein VI685_16115 [Candidatus Angelobacter sp.]
MYRVGIQILGIACWFYSAAPAQSIPTVVIDGVYQGAMGRQQIVLEIGAVDPHRNDHTCTEVPAQAGWNVVCFNDGNGPDQPIEGRYFYRRHGVAILVEGSILADGSFRFQEYQDGKPSGAEWRLCFKENKATGFFCRCDVRDRMDAPASATNISLTRVSTGFDPGLSSADPAGHAPDRAYYDLLLDFPLRTSTEVRVNERIGYIMQTDERFKISLPHLTTYPDVTIMDRVNQDLSRHLERARLDAAFCLQGIDFRGGEWEQKLRVAAFTDTILSIVQESSYYCGGPHSDVVTEPLAYDMRTGRVLDLKDIFRVQHESAILEHGVVPAGPVHSLLLQLYRSRYVKSSDECDAEDFNSDTTLKMYFDQRGLVIIPELSHADQGCGPKVEIPHEELRVSIDTQ